MEGIRHRTAKVGIAILAVVLGLLVQSEGDAAATRLKIFHIDVEQGDAAVIISPGGQVAMVDDGPSAGCSNVISFLNARGISRIAYHFASHYHADHIGCLDDMANAGITVRIACYDRGGSYNSQAFDNYVATCGAKRKTLYKGQVIKLDRYSPTPVRIKVIDLNGAGTGTTDENAKSVVLRVRFGAFSEVLGGELTGLSPYPDIESLVASGVGDVEVYKVHHHGSKYSTNNYWLDVTRPEVGIVSVGANGYGHPTCEALNRLHNHKVETYWTNPGSGCSPNATWDHVGGTIRVSASSSSTGTFTISGSSFKHTYYNR